MICTSPSRIWAKDSTEYDHRMDVPCGNCRACRKERARQWAVRIMHESMSYKDNCYITLTEDDDHLEYAGGTRPTIYKPNVQNFLKRLRKNLDDPKYNINEKGSKFRYFAVGEYGDRFKRPHYHLCLFGQDFRNPSGITKNGTEITMQEAFLDPSWGRGHTHVDKLEWGSALYVAQYVQKKLNGPLGEYYEKEGIMPEFALMSRRPGLGEKHFREHYQECGPDYIPVNGVKTGLPRYYRNIKYDTDDKKSTYKNKIDVILKEKEELQKKKGARYGLHARQVEMQERSQRALNYEYKAQGDERITKFEE
jgi:hypothetical protein